MKTTHSVSLHENKQNSAYQTLKILLIYQFICWKLPFGRRNLFSCFLPLVGNYSPVIRQLDEDFVANMRKWVGEQFQSCKEFANILASAVSRVSLPKVERQTNKAAATAAKDAKRVSMECRAEEKRVADTAQRKL